MKIKLFTHIKDLDGIGNAILAKLAFNDVDISFCDYGEPVDINETIKKFIDEKGYQKFDKIFMTDLSINESNANLVNRYFSKKMILLDHHKTAEWLNKYNWAYVTEKIDGILTCGTELFHNWLLDNVPEYKKIYDDKEEFVDLVTDCDTWMWEKKGNVKARQLADLLSIYGKEKFIDKMVSELKDHKNVSFNDTDKLLLELEDNERNKYIEEKARQIKFTTIDEYYVGVVFAERYASDLGNQLAKLYPEYDFIAMINPGSGISLRGIKEIDLGAIAKKFGGGGHLKSAGGPISDEQQQQMIDIIFGDKNE